MKAFCTTLALGVFFLLVAIGVMPDKPQADAQPTPAPTVEIEVTPIGAPAEIRWQRWTLADGTITWGPCEGCEVYESFREAVVLPARERAKGQPQSQRGYSVQCGPNGCSLQAVPRSRILRGR